MTARTFLAAAATGSFAGAAKQVNTSPSSVTERIKQLEHMLCVQLFDRDRSGCRLTPAGRRFVEPASNLVRAWEQGRLRVALPEKFSRSVRVGGQYALWPTLLVPWLIDVMALRDDVAFRAVSAAPSQLNRDLVEDELDLVFLYDPIIRKGIKTVKLVQDWLVLVTANPSVDWRTNFTRIDWGEDVAAKLAALIGELPNPGLDIDLGILSLDWLIISMSSGYVPQYLARRQLQEGKLHLVPGTPRLEFSPYACWRESLPKDLAEALVDTAISKFRG